MDKQHNFQDPLKVRVRVFDVTNDKQIRCYTFDYNDVEKRARFFKSAVWALINGHALELVGTEFDT